MRKEISQPADSGRFLNARAALAWSLGWQYDANGVPTNFDVDAPDSGLTDLDVIACNVSLAVCDAWEMSDDEASAREEALAGRREFGARHGFRDHDEWLLQYDALIWRARAEQLLSTFENDLPTGDALDMSARQRAVAALRWLIRLSSSAAHGFAEDYAEYKAALGAAQRTTRAYAAQAGRSAGEAYRSKIRLVGLLRLSRCMPCRRQRQRARRSHRVICAAAKKTGDPDPDPEPPRPRALCSSTGGAR